MSKRIPDETMSVISLVTKKSICSAAMVLGASILTAPPVFAEYIPPHTVKVKTVRYKEINPAPTPGLYDYAISWQGIPVAKARVSVTDKKCDPGDCAKVTVKAITSSVIDLFYKMRHESEGVFLLSPFRPLLFFTKSKENRREKMRSVIFKGDGEIESESWKKGRDRTTANFETDNFTLDPISAAFLAKSVPIDIGSVVDMDVFNGKHRYLISFAVESLEELEVAGEKRKCFVVSPSILKLTDSEGEPRFQSAKLWISADSRRDLLKLESEVWIGSVVAELEKFSASKKVPEFHKPNKPIDESNKYSGSKI